MVFRLPQNELIWINTLIILLIVYILGKSKKRIVAHRKIIYLFVLNQTKSDLNQTEIWFVQNLSENDKHNLISVWFNKIWKKFLCVPHYVYFVPVRLMQWKCSIYIGVYIYYIYIRFTYIGICKGNVFSRIIFIIK